jgi:hypothetical protein
VCVCACLLFYMPEKGFSKMVGWLLTRITCFKHNSLALYKYIYIYIYPAGDLRGYIVTLRYGMKKRRPWEYQSTIYTSLNTGLALHILLSFQWLFPFFVVFAIGLLSRFLYPILD